MAQRKIEKSPFVTYGIPAAASSLIEYGNIVAVNSSGYGLHAADVAEHKVRGVCINALNVDNSSGSNGDQTITVERGVFKFKNSATNALTVANIGSNCYIENSTTVSSDGGTNSIVAGVVMAVESDGVFVKIGE